MTAMPKWVAQLTYRLYRQRTDRHFIWTAQVGSLWLEIISSDALQKNPPKKQNKLNLGIINWQQRPNVFSNI